ncbi:MAG: hypothetical protein GY754_38665 [bacterium]|nr:hypothetical protein [bacterium]
MKKTILFKAINITLLLLLFFAAANQGNLYSEENPGPKTKRYNLESGPEYYYPVDDDRNIQTIFMNALFGKEFINELHYSLYAGLTATYARVI